MVKYLVLALCLMSGVNYAQDSVPYFQQRVDYKISVRLDDKNHLLHAHERFTYTNHAPIALDTIWIHLWPNAYSSDKTALAKQLKRNRQFSFHYSTPDQRGYIDSLDFTANGQKLNWGFHKQHPDIGYILLPASLAPESSITIETPFRVKIPDARFSRLGHVEESYMITQWYPKPAVFDRNGWHAMPYLSQGEFYSEYGSFQVSVTIPKNYVVGATGDIQEASEREWLDSLALVTTEKLKNTKDLKSTNYYKFPPSSEQYKTLTYKIDNVHDFAWFADKRWLVLRGSVELPNSKRRVETWAMFTGQYANLWKNSIEYLNDATHYYSLWNGDYPYNHVTAVDGTIAAGGGMEYPNITVIGSTGSAIGLETVIVHEVGHNWFYGILGTNERKRPWMDEGLNSLNESRYIATKYPNLTLADEVFGLSKELQQKFRLDIHKQASQYHLFYLVNAVRNLDQPIELPADEYTSTNYGGIVYSKTAAMFNYLRNYLGDEMFDNCMQTYYDRWKFKHPGPDDLRAVFEELTGKNMSWFFQDIIQTTGTLDFKIKRTKKPAKGVIWKDAFIKVKSKGTINGPFSISSVKDGQPGITVWYDSVPPKGIVQFPDASPDHWRIDHYHAIPEVNRQNNILKSSGLLRKKEKLRFHWITGLQDPERTTTYMIPFIAGNHYDGPMIGMAFHNFELPEKKFQWALAPMFGFRSMRPTGMGHFQYRMSTTKNYLFQQAYILGNIKSFSIGNEQTYGLTGPACATKGSLMLDLMVKKKRLASPHEHRIQFETIAVNERMTVATDQIENNYNTYWGITHKYQLKLPLLQIDYQGNFRGGFNSLYTQEFMTLSDEITAKFVYKTGKKTRPIFMRAFGGYFIDNISTSARYNWQADGPGRWLGVFSSDYRYDHFYLGRNEPAHNFLAQQVVRDHGGMIAQTAYSSNSWMVGFNIDAKLPIPILSVFYNAVFLPMTIFTPTGIKQGTTTLMDAGIKINLINDVCAIYIPVWANQPIQDEWSTNNIKFWNRIRFTMNLHNANPVKLLNSAL